MAEALSFSDAEPPQVKGRPPRPVDREQVESLLKLRFTWKEISSLLDVSPRTLQRRAREWQITKYSSISDDTLDEAVGSIIGQFPLSGEVMIKGFLQSQNVSMRIAKTNDT